MSEQAEEDRHYEGEDLTLIGNTVSEETVTEVVLDNPNELFLLKETWLGFL